MSIVLLILKIIGIILLSALCLILAVLLAVLFVPLRYTLVAEKYEDTGFKASLKVTWLLHLLNILVYYTEELFYRVRITVIPIIKSDNLKKKKKKQQQNHQKQQNQKETSNHEVSEYKNEYLIEEKKDSITYSEINDTDNDTDNDANNDTLQLEDDEEDIKLSLFDKIVLAIEKIVDIVTNLNEKIDALINKIIDIRDNIEYYVDAINDKKNQEVFSLCYGQLSRVLKNIKPKKIEGKAHIGFEDPYTMGQMFTIYGILFPIIHDKIQLTPEYDKDIIEGYINIKGRITVFVLVYAFIKIYFNKNFRRMQKIFKREQ